jgi:hypothetical protein
MSDTAPETPDVAPVVPVVPVPAPTPAEPNPADSAPVSNSGYNRYKPCALCLRTISVFDTSAGCQDPSGSHPECDRLAAVEADNSTSGTDVESPVAESDATPIDTTADVVSKLEAAVKELEANA